MSISTDLMEATLDGRITTADRDPENADQSEIARLHARVAELEEGFRVYGFHHYDCEAVAGLQCTCGLTDLLENGVSEYVGDISPRSLRARLDAIQAEVVQLRAERDEANKAVGEALIGRLAMQGERDAAIRERDEARATGRELAEEFMAMEAAMLTNVSSEECDAARGRMETALEAVLPEVRAPRGESK